MKSNRNRFRNRIEIVIEIEIEGEIEIEWKSIDHIAKLDRFGPKIVKIRAIQHFAFFLAVLIFFCRLKKNKNWNKNERNKC